MFIHKKLRNSKIAYLKEVSKKGVVGVAPYQRRDYLKAKVKTIDGVCFSSFNEREKITFILCAHIERKKSRAEVCVRSCGVSGRMEVGDGKKIC